MQVVWKGSVAFGLVNVPVRLYTATQDNDISFHQVHAADGGRIKYQRTCQQCGQVVAFAEIAKAYEASDGRVVMLSDDDMAILDDKSSQEMSVIEFVPVQQVDPILLSKSYWLEPEKAAVKPYVLLRQALQSTERIAIVSITMRNRTRLAALRVVEGKLLVQTMLWPDEVRHPTFASLTDEVNVRPQEEQMAALLVESLGADFDPDAFTDTRRERITAMLQAKLEGGEVLAPQEPQVVESGQVLDLLAALRASVDAAQRQREDNTPTHVDLTKERTARMTS